MFLYVFSYHNIGLVLVERIYSMKKMEVSHNDIKLSYILWKRIINSVISDKKIFYFIDFGKASKIENNIKFNNSKNYKSHYNDLKTK